MKKIIIILVAVVVIWFIWKAISKDEVMVTDNNQPAAVGEMTLTTAPASNEAGPIGAGADQFAY